MNIIGKNNINLIYLDNHATTPCDPRVVEEMLPYFSEAFGNPSSTIHSEGRKVADAVEAARSQVAKLINARPKEIIFTSGATESNNIAVQGLIRQAGEKRKKIITSRIEHKAILNQCKALEKLGYETQYLTVNKFGEINLDQAEELVDENTLIVSIQTASNEIGTIQPIKSLAKIAHSNGAYFHTDAAQAIGKIPIDVHDWDVDLLSISAHKFYGPKGIGALYIKGGAYSIPISPLVYGGEQEFNLRSGTLNVPGIIGIGKACELCSSELEKDSQHLSSLRNYLEKALIEQVELCVNGSIDNRLPNNSSLTFPGLDAEALVVNMPELAISTGSACTSGALEPSHVLQAIGMSREEADSTLRIGLGRFNTREEIVEASSIIVRTVEKLNKSRL